MGLTPKPASDRALWRRAFPFLSADARAWTAALLLAPIPALAAMLQPWLFQVAIDDTIARGDLAHLKRLVVAFLLVLVVGFAGQVAHTWTLSLAATRTIRRLREALQEHLLALDARFHDREPTGKLATRATTDIDALGDTLNAGAFTLLLDVLQVCGVVGAMVWMNPRLSAILLLVGPPLAWTINRLRRVLRRWFAEIHATQGAMNGWLAERLESVSTIQLLADERRSERALADHIDRYTQANLSANVWDATLFAVVDGVSGLTTALLLAAASGWWFDIDVTPGVFAAFLDYLARLFTPVQEFSQKVAVLQRAGAALEKVVDVLDAPIAVADGTQTLDRARGHLTLSGVGFGYHTGAPVLRDIDLDIPAGTRIALVGRTGSGKTTLTALLNRTYDVTVGCITLDGHDVRTLTLASLRRAVAAVRQDVAILPGTLRFNLDLEQGRPDAVLWDALRRCQAADLAERLGGLDAELHGALGGLSAGEAQVIALARILVHDPAVVVLDEATANIDTLTEARLQRATEAALEGRTTVVVAHRLSTILGADRIVVLDAGQVIETGSHDALLAADGAYAALYRGGSVREGSEAGAALA
jgi:ATP-binding cassette subfamily B multidrug efflux pump